MTNWLVINSYVFESDAKKKKKGIAIHSLKGKGKYISTSTDIFKTRYLIYSLSPSVLNKFDDIQESPELWEFIRDTTKACCEHILDILPLDDWRVIDLTKEWLCGTCSEVYNNFITKKYSNYGYAICENCLEKEYKYEFNHIQYVYFIKESLNHSVKIGQSSNVEKRLEIFQTGSPSNLTIELKIPTYDGRSGEKFFHKLFSAYHIRREWYAIEENMLEFLKTVNKKLLSKGFSLIDILNNSQDEFNNLKEIEEYVENWIEKNPKAKNPDDFFRIYCSVQ